MKLTTIKDALLEDDFVDVRYRELTPDIHEIIQICQKNPSILICEKEGTSQTVDVHDVLYIEWVDSRCCVYTADDVYTLSVSLSQLESALKDQHFVRISKMALVNLFKVKSVSNGLNFKLTVKIVNGESVMVSRHYRGELLAAINKLAKEIVR